MRTIYCVSGSDQDDSYYVSDRLLVCVCVCVCVFRCYMCGTCLSKTDVGFHADMLREGYKSVSPVTAHLLLQRAFSLRLNLCASRPHLTRLPFSVPPRCGISPAGCATSSWRRRKSSKKESEESWPRRRRRSGRHWRRRPERTWPMQRR